MERREEAQRYEDDMEALLDSPEEQPRWNRVQYMLSRVFDVHLQALLDAAEEQHALKLAIAVQTAISSAGGAGDVCVVTGS